MEVLSRLDQISLPTVSVDNFVQNLAPNRE
jgi:hypothetical protein